MLGRWLRRFARSLLKFSTTKRYGKGSFRQDSGTDSDDQPSIKLLVPSLSLLRSWKRNDN